MDILELLKLVVAALSGAGGASWLNRRKSGAETESIQVRTALEIAEYSRKQVEGLTEDVRILRAELATMRAEIVNRDIRIASLEDDNRRLRQRATELQAEVDQLRAEVGAIGHPEPAA